MWSSLLYSLGVARSDILFARDDANRFLPWILGLMVSLTAFALCLGMTLGQWISSHQLVYGQDVSLIIPPQPDSMQGDVKNLIAMVEKAPNVEKLRVLEPQEVLNMVQPWLGDDAAMKDLPLPTMAEITIRRQPLSGSKDIKALTERVATMIPGTQLDTHESWARKFGQFTAALQALAYGVAAFILLALSAMIVFTSQAALKLHRRPVELLHSIGADDGYIARQFQWNATALMLQGAIPGTVLGYALYMALGSYSGSLDTPLLPQLKLSLSHLALALALPLGCALLGLCASRFAVLRELRRVL